MKENASEQIIMGIIESPTLRAHYEREAGSACYFCHTSTGANDPDAEQVALSWICGRCARASVAAFEAQD